MSDENVSSAAAPAVGTYICSPSMRPAPEHVTQRFIAMGCTELVCLETFRENPKSLLAPSGLAATFPANSKFVRDAFIGLPLCFGVSVFNVTVPWEKDMPETQRERARAAVNRLVPDESPSSPKWNEAVNACWIPGLGRGGTVGLYQQFAQNEDYPRWLIVVAAGPDGETLDDFEIHLATYQADPNATFGGAVPAFATLEALSERLRGRLAAAFADAIGVELVSPIHGAEATGSSDPVISDSGSDNDNEKDTKEALVAVKQWVGTASVPAVYRVPRRAPLFTESGFPENFAGMVLHGDQPTVRHGNAVWSVSWNTLRVRGSNVVFCSDCVIPTKTPMLLPFLGDPKSFVTYEMGASDDILPVPVLSSPVISPFPPTDSPLVFTSDHEGRRAFPQHGVVRAAIERARCSDRTVSHAVLVRVSNRDYAGNVEGEFSTDDADDPCRAVRELFALPGDAYVPPA